MTIDDPAGRGLLHIDLRMAEDGSMDGPLVATLEHHDGTLEPLGTIQDIQMRRAVIDARLEQLRARVRDWRWADDDEED